MDESQTNASQEGTDGGETDLVASLTTQQGSTVDGSDGIANESQPSEPEQLDRLDKHPRFQEAIKQKNTYKAQVEELKKRVAEMSAPTKAETPTQKAQRESKYSKYNLPPLRSPSEYNDIEELWEDMKERDKALDAAIDNEAKEQQAQAQAVLEQQAQEARELLGEEQYDKFKEFCKNFWAKSPNSKLEISDLVGLYQTVDGVQTTDKVAKPASKVNTSSKNIASAANNADPTDREIAESVFANISRH